MRLPGPVYFAPPAKSYPFLAATLASLASGGGGLVLGGVLAAGLMPAGAVRAAAIINIAGTGLLVNQISGVDGGNRPVTLDSAWRVVAYPNSPTTYPTNGVQTGCMTSPTRNPATVGNVLPDNCLLMNRQPGNTLGTGPVVAYNPIIVNPNSATDPATRIFNSIPSSGSTPIWSSDVAGVNGWTDPANATKYYWLGPNLDSRATFTTNYSSGYIQSFWRQYCPTSDLNATCYSWILQTTITVPKAATYKFNFTLGVDNIAKVYVGGTIDSSVANFPTITGGQLVAERTQTNNPGGQNGYTVGATNGFSAALEAGTTTLSIVITDGYSVTGALVGNSFAEEVPAPLPLLGASAAFGWSRRLRRRVTRARSSPADAGPIPWQAGFGP